MINKQREHLACVAARKVALLMSLHTNGRCKPGRISRARYSSPSFQRPEAGSSFEGHHIRPGETSCSVGHRSGGWMAHAGGGARLQGMSGVLRDSGPGKDETIRRERIIQIRGQMI